MPKIRRLCSILVNIRAGHIRTEHKNRKLNSGRYCVKHEFWGNIRPNFVFFSKIKIQSSVGFIRQIFLSAQSENDENFPVTSISMVHIARYSYPTLDFYFVLWGVIVKLLLFESMNLIEYEILDMHACTHRFVEL